MLKAKYGHTETAEMLIVNNVDINATDNNDCTALHYAKNQKQTDTAIKLVYLGANVDLFDKLRAWLGLGSE